MWGKIFKKNIYSFYEKKLDSSIKIGEDHACVKPLIYHSNSMVILSECMYYYRQNQESATKSLKPFLWSAPKLISKHIENQIPMNIFDFQEQVYRMTVHNLFNVAVSQFNQNKSYNEIKRNIIKNINDTYYQIAIKKCKYVINSKGILALFALKYKCIRLIWIYNKLKNNFNI